MTDDGLGDKIVGTAKETLGKLTGDGDLELDGIADQAQGAIKDATEGIKSGLGDAGEKIKGLFNK